MGLSHECNRIISVLGNVFFSTVVSRGFECNHINGVMGNVFFSTVGDRGFES